MKRNGPRAKPLEERLAKYVNVNGPLIRPYLGPCHVWTGATASGYGTLVIGSRTDGSRRMIGAHVLAFFLANGRWPAPQALHHCDHRPCVKAKPDKDGPAHIFEGTVRDNALDMVAKGRQYQHQHPETVRGERNPRAILSAVDADAIRRGDEQASTLAARYGVSVSTIHSVRSHATWNEDGKNHAVPKQMSAETVFAIRAATGTQREIARRYGTSQSHVSAIKRRRFWKNLEEKAS